MLNPERTVMALTEFEVSEAALAPALARTAEVAGRVRTMRGNVGFRVLLDPSATSRVCIRHEWDSEDALRTYLDSDAFSELGSILRPLMLSQPRRRVLTTTPLDLPA